MKEDAKCKAQVVFVLIFVADPFDRLLQLLRAFSPFDLITDPSMMLKILFLCYLLALWFWNAWHQADSHGSHVGASNDPVHSVADPIHG